MGGGYFFILFANSPWRLICQNTTGSDKSNNSNLITEKVKCFLGAKW